MKIIQKSILFLLLNVMALTLYGQIGPDFVLFSQINSGTVFKENGGNLVTAIIAPPVMVVATIGDLNINSGFDLPIVITGVDAHLQESWNIKVYPTVIRDNVSISCINTLNREFYINVFDVLGNKIYLADVNNKAFKDLVNINVSNIGAPGMYFFTIYSKSSTFYKTFRIIKVD